MVSHRTDLGRRDSGMASDRAQDISRLDQSSTRGAVLLEGPENVSGLQWDGTTAEYSLWANSSRAVDGQNSQVQRTSIGFHRQPPGADVVGLVPPNTVCLMPSQVAVTRNSRVDSRCGASDVDSDGIRCSA